MKTVYICNGKKEDCRKTGCKYTGMGSCRHTCDPHYALHDPKDQHFIQTERGDLWEVDDAE